MAAEAGHVSFTLSSKHRWLAGGVSGDAESIARLTHDGAFYYGIMTINRTMYKLEKDGEGNMVRSG